MSNPTTLRHIFRFRWRSIGAIFICALALLGNMFDSLDILRRWLPEAVTMKPVTAACGILSAFAMIGAKGRTKISETIVGTTSVLTIGLLLYTMFIYHHSPKALEAEEIMTTAPGIPSWGTGLMYLFVVTGLWFYVNANAQVKNFCGWVAVGLGSIALLGYLLGVATGDLSNFKLLFYRHVEVSTAMAIPTAIISLLLGRELLKINELDHDLGVHKG